MNNYTVVIRARQAGITADQVKAAVEDILLHALPPVTLHFGVASQPDANTILVVVSSDGKRDFLAGRLREIENRLPIYLERIEWGSQAAQGTAAGRMPLFPTFNYLRTDPYADAAPQSEPVYCYRPSTWSNLRGAFSTVFLLLWVILLILYLATNGRGFPVLPGKLPRGLGDAVVAAALDPGRPALHALAHDHCDHLRSGWH